MKGADTAAAEALARQSLKKYGAGDACTICGAEVKGFGQCLNCGSRITDPTTCESCHRKVLRSGVCAACFGRKRAKDEAAEPPQKELL